MIYSQIYNTGSLNTKFIPVIFDPAHAKYIPTPLQGATRYCLYHEYEKLYNRLIRSGLPPDPKEVAGYLKARLNRAYDPFLQTAPGNSYASADEDGWCLLIDTPANLQRDSLD